MTNSLDVHDDVEAYVLGALDTIQATAFESHLTNCPDCQREVATYVPVMGALRELPLPTAPPLRINRNNVVPLRAILASAAAAVLLLGGLGESLVQRMQNDDMVTVAEMGATSSQQVSLRGDGVQGRAIVGQKRQRTAFVVAGLPEPGPDRDYQVWIDNGSSTSPGVLHRAASGFEVLVVSGDVLRGARRITVTLEASGGSSHMSGRPIISGISEA